MDIQWLIVARAWRINKNGTLDIAGIFDHVTVHNPPYYISAVLLAKVRYKPMEVGENKIITMQVNHLTDGIVGSIDLPYKVPDISSWATETPFIAVDLDEFQFPKTGEYSFRLLIEGKLQAEEWITIVV